MQRIPKSPVPGESRAIQKLRIRLRPILTHGIAPHLDAVGVVDQAVKNPLVVAVVAILSNNKRLNDTNTRMAPLETKPEHIESLLVKKLGIN
jgi:hypothetical protein